MKRFFLIVTSLSLSFFTNAQLNNDFVTRYKVQKIRMEIASRHDTSIIIDNYGAHGFIISREKVGDTSSDGKKTFTYKFDNSGQLISSATYNRNGELVETSVYQYYDFNGFRFKDQSIKGYKVNMLNGHIDTTIYNKDKLIWYINSPWSKEEYFYDSCNLLIKRINSSKNRKDVFEYISVYNEQRKLIRQDERANGQYLSTSIYEYDEKGRCRQIVQFPYNHSEDVSQVVKYYYD